MILLILGFYVRLVSSLAIDPHLPHNVTIDIRDYLQKERLTAADSPQAIPLFFETAINKLNTSYSALTAPLESAGDKSQSSDHFNEIPFTNTDFLLRINGSNVPISILNGGGVSKSLGRAKRQVQKEKPWSELPRWPGMPQGVLRQGPETIPVLKKKILDLMLQSMYSAQERLWPIEPIIRKYEHLTPYRMAFIFMKLDQLVHEAHSILMYLERQKTDLTMTRRLQLYSHLMRRNIDVTYLVDYVSQRVPRDQMVRVRQYVIRKEQEALMSRYHVYAAKATGAVGRPQRRYFYGLQSRCANATTGRLDVMILLLFTFYVHWMLASSLETSASVARNVSIDLASGSARSRAGAPHAPPTTDPIIAFTRTATIFLEDARRMNSENNERLKKKALSIMKQAMFLAQERLWTVEPILEKYQGTVGYRMAYIYMQLDQLVHEGAGIMRYLYGMRYWESSRAPISPNQRIQVYWQLVRRNIDVTFLVDYIISHVPQNNIVLLREWVAKKEKEDLQKMLRQKKNKH